jgi:hypothetical protein
MRYSQDGGTVSTCQLEGDGDLGKRKQERDLAVKDGPVFGKQRQ